MSDEVKGLAVLNDLLAEQVLYFVCVPDKALHRVHNEPFVMRIRVRPAGTPKTFYPQWEWRAEGDLLHVAPSVDCGAVFHNAGTWSVPFVRWSELAPVRGEAEGGAWSACYDLNPGLVG